MTDRDIFHLVMVLILALTVIALVWMGAKDVASQLTLLAVLVFWFFRVFD